MMQRGLLKLTFGILFLLLLGFTQTVGGQAVSGTLLGTVTDTTGAIVAGAQVTATLTSTGATHDSTTNSSGNYAFPDMQPGIYTITIDAKGFKKSEQRNINLLSDTSPRVDVTLQPGNVSETVVVTTAPPQLQTDRADISTKIEAVSVMELPLTTNRNFQSLLNLVPGASPATFQHSQFFNAQDSLQTQANGMPRVSNLYQIEGIDDDERTGLLQILIPPAEAIQSVDMSTNNYEPELGRSVGAITNVTLKSGTNQFHGSAFEYIQNNSSTLALTSADRSVISPTITLAALWADRSRRTSCSSSAISSASDDSEAISSTYTVPDARWYTNSGVTTGCTDPTGCIDLSAAINGSAGKIYDPSTGDGSAAHPRTQFTNNQIPISRINPVSLTMLKDLYAAAAKVWNPEFHQASVQPDE